MKPVPITDGIPSLEYHCIYKNVKECSICGEIEFRDDPSEIYLVLYYPENNPNFKME